MEASLSPPWNPCSLGTAPGTGGALTDLALDLAQISAGFRRSLPPSLLTSLADLVRSMNCYYSNLIEGHDTHPVDIERALKKRLPARMPASATCSSKPRHTSPCSSGSITGPPRRPCRQSRRNLGDSPALLRFLARGSPVGRRPGDQRTGPVGARRTAQARLTGRKPRRRQSGVVPRFLERFAQVYGNAGKT